MSRKQLLSRFSANLILLVAVLWVPPAFGQYILNTQTNVVHAPSCRTIQTGNEVGRQTVRGGEHFVDVATTDGYRICGVCGARNESGKHQKHQSLT